MLAMAKKSSKNSDKWTLFTKQKSSRKSKNKNKNKNPTMNKAKSHGGHGSKRSSFKRNETTFITKLAGSNSNNDGNSSDNYKNRRRQPHTATLRLNVESKSNDSTGGNSGGLGSSLISKAHTFVSPNDLPKAEKKLNRVSLKLTSVSDEIKESDSSNNNIHIKTSFDDNFASSNNRTSNRNSIINNGSKLSEKRPSSTKLHNVTKMHGITIGKELHLISFVALKEGVAHHERNDSSSVSNVSTGSSSPTGTTCSNGGGTTGSIGSGNKILNKSKKKHKYDYSKYTQSHKMHSTEAVDTQIIRKRGGYGGNNKTGNSNINSNNSKKGLKQQQIFSFSQQQSQTQSHSGHSGHSGHHQIQLSGDSHNSHSEDSATKLTILPIILQKNASNDSNISGVSFDTITEEPNGMMSNNSNSTIHSGGSFDGVFLIQLSEQRESLSVNKIRQKVIQALGLNVTDDTNGNGDGDSTNNNNDNMYCDLASTMPDLELKFDFDDDFDDEPFKPLYKVSKGLIFRKLQSTATLEQRFCVK